MKRNIFIAAAMLLMSGCENFDVPEVTPDPDAIISDRIYASDRHCAFPTLTHWQGKFYAAFREGITHSGAGGVVQVLSSADGKKWEDFQTLKLNSDEPSAPPREDEVSFNGVNQYMMIPHDKVFDFEAGDSFSVSAWVQTENTNYSMLVSTRAGGDGYDFGHQSNWLFADLQSPKNTNDTYIRVQSGPDYDSGIWQHIAYVYNGSAKTFDIYIDGKISSSPGTSGSIYPARPFTVQSNTYGNNIFVFARASNRGESAGGNYSKGMLRDLRFWNKALSSEEVNADMTAEVTSSTSGLIAAYDFSKKAESGKDYRVEDIMKKNPGYLKNMLAGDEATADLRDPRILHTPDGRMMIIADGEKYDGGSIVSRRPYVSYLGSDGVFSEFVESSISYPDEQEYKGNAWIWSPKFNGNTLYGFDYINKFALMKSEDYGRTFTTVKDFDRKIFGNPSETDMTWDDQGRMHAFVRRNGAGSLLENSKAFYGISESPYTDWTFKELDYRLEGQSVMFKDADSFIIGSRRFDANNANPKMAVYLTDLQGRILKEIILRSGSDCSYPGMVVHEDNLYVVYYSAHQGVASIFSSIIPMSDLQYGLKYHEDMVTSPDWIPDTEGHQWK